MIAAGPESCLIAWTLPLASIPAFKPLVTGLLDGLDSLAGSLRGDYS
jgi:hypothetical protein